MMVFSALEVYDKEQKKRHLTEDLIELSDIKYGMFNVDQWTAILADLVAKKVQDFDLTKGNKDDLNRRVSAFLYTTISDFEDRFYKENRGIGGFFKKSAASLFNVFEDIKKDIPNFTEDIIAFLDDPENKEQIRAYMLKELSGYADDTFSEMDYSVRDDILSIHGYPSGEEAIAGMKQEIEEMDESISGNRALLFGIIFGTGLLVMLLKTPTVAEFSILTLMSLVLLLSGLSLPMIDIDARISEMNFTLLGEHINFNDQVLYFKSKSILEIVSVMLSQGKLDVLMVGLLVLLFSVLFPLSKLVCSCIYLYAEKLRDSKFIRFMVFRTGKWSMADVMVIAIFMSYIGFSGILTEQLSHLGGLAKSVEILTTNETQLKIGFFLFTAFAVMSLLISHRMQYSLKFTNAQEPVSQNEPVPTSEERP
ncbi:MAG: hypothetical protein Roseis2KO_10740 [Roseivirga sp.]